jgi:predicted hotdog family 3-hydroxylacyl-ACP dehydratase
MNNHQQQEVLAYLPQRPPFVMIDHLLQADDRAIITSFTIREGHELVREGAFTEAGLVENMAQTAAAGTGARARQAGITPPVGFIGALKNLIIKELPCSGETITTEVIFVHQVMNAHIVQGTVRIGERIVATCELKIFLQEEAPATSG